MDNSIKELIVFLNEKLEEIAINKASEVAVCYDGNKEFEERKLYEILRSYFEEEQGFLPNFTKPYGRENARTIKILHHRWMKKNQRIIIPPDWSEAEANSPSAFPKLAAFVGSKLLSRHRRWDTRSLRTILFRAGEL